MEEVAVAQRRDGKIATGILPFIIGMTTDVANALGMSEE